MKKRLLSLVPGRCSGRHGVCGVQLRKHIKFCRCDGARLVCSERNQRGKERIYDRMSGGG